MMLPKRKYRNLLLVLTSLCSSTVIAAYVPPHEAAGFSLRPTCYRWMGALLGGYANLNTPNDTHSYSGTDDDIFTYRNHNNGKSDGYIGAFLGMEWQLARPDLFLQTGLEYSYYGSVNFTGTNAVGIEPATSTNYTYRYHYQTQQLLAVAKLLASAYQIYHPYLSAGIGAAFNYSSRYSATTAQTGSINITPTFHSRTKTSFSYTVGVGVDADISRHARIGAGYQFSDFGKSRFGNGQVTFNNYNAPVSFSLSNSHTYVNQLIVQLSYLG